MRRTALAGLALALLVACEPEDETPRVRAAPSSAPRMVEELEVVADLSVSSAAPDTTLTTVRSERLRAGRGRVALFAIERPAVRPRCVVEALLRLFLERSSGPVEEELALYPSHVFDAATKRDGERFGYSGSLLDVRPRGAVEDAGSGWSEWDVTAIVKRWIGRGVFPSVGHRAPERGPVVLALRDVDGAEPFATVTMASADARANPPRLVLVTPEGCA